MAARCNDSVVIPDKMEYRRMTDYLGDQGIDLPVRARNAMTTSFFNSCNAFIVNYKAEKLPKYDVEANQASPTPTVSAKPLKRHATS